MQRQQLGASLQIVQQQDNNFYINHNTSDLIKMNLKKYQSESNQENIFQLSLDQYSLSFEIQKGQQVNHKKDYLNLKSEKQIQNHFMSNVNSEMIKKNNLVVVQEQRKRKRKQIFEKYKKPKAQNIQQHLQTYKKTEQLMNKFDQIFSIKSLQNIQKSIQKNSIQQTKTNYFQKMSHQQKFITNQTKNSQLIKIKNPQTSCDNKLFIDEFTIPSKISDIVFNEQGTVVINSTDSFLLQEKHKISMIQSYPYEEQTSRDQSDLTSILQSQIFNDEILNNTIQVGDVTYKNFQISTVNPSLIIENQPIKYFASLDSQNSFALTKQAPFINDNKSSQKVVKLLKNPSKKIFFIKMENKNLNYVKDKAINYTQTRIPEFLRQVRKLNTVIPNFFIHSKNINIFLEQNQKMKELFHQFTKALEYLNFTNEMLYEINRYFQKFKSNLINSLTLAEFMKGQWAQIYQIHGIQQLRPNENFIKRPYDYLKVNEALSNYMKVIDFYQRYNLNLCESIAQKKYFQIRNKFWQIQKNIKMISEDIYSQFLNLGFPSHYYEYLSILNNDILIFPLKEKVQYLRSKLNQYYQLKHSSDVLCMSQIGQEVRRKIQKMIQKQLVI